MSVLETALYFKYDEYCKDVLALKLEPIPLPRFSSVIFPLMKLSKKDRQKVLVYLTKKET